MSNKNNNSYTVYMHINKINGKRYIGITSQKPQYRWSNGKGYPNNEHFTNAINLYGWDNFEHIIVAEGLSEEQAKQMEIELIAYYDTTNKEKGYNVTKGGESLSGYNHTEEWKQQQSERMSGENHPNFGRYGELSSNTRKVITIINGVPFASFDYILQGAEYFNIKNSSHISECCNGNRKSCGKDKNGKKIQWKYLFIQEL